MPTVNEIVQGLLEWIVMQSEERCKDYGVNQKRRAVKNTKGTMVSLLDTVSLEKALWDMPLKQGKNRDLDLTNPYSPVACWVLHLYSMELGTPALYMELNRVCREMDMTLIK